VHKVFTPPRRKGGEKWEGEPAELAAKLAKVIREII